MEPDGPELTGDEHGPVPVADAVVRLGFSGRAARAARFAVPGVTDLIARRQFPHPYRVVRFNDGPLQ
ncbi:hypothetical protein [Streptomyces sp. GZWMJZ-114]|uniref:hypothetical protein n=1 Tax=Streptomyces sp. GZWMJZ-114 TaxID=2494734 RepID=UPI001F506E55|nr:hypothetical protein [Streptomyces sp. GZWMJZ-114]